MVDEKSVATLLNVLCDFLHIMRTSPRTLLLGLEFLGVPGPALEVTGPRLILPGIFEGHKMGMGSMVELPVLPPRSTGSSWFLHGRVPSSALRRFSAFQPECLQP